MTEISSTQDATSSPIRNDHFGSFAQAFFIANLLFIGIFYLLLWILYFFSYKKASATSKRHLKQTLIASSASTFIVIALNVFILLTTNYASVTALLMAEVYLMMIVPLFMIVGIIGFSKAVQGQDFKFPFLGRFIH